jgi:hypothetical protein
MKQVAIAIDQLINTMLGGYADETLSARAHRMRVKKQPYWGWTANVIDKLFFWQEAHCGGAYLAEMKRSQLPREFQQNESKP